MKAKKSDFGWTLRNRMKHLASSFSDFNDFKSWKNVDNMVIEEMNVWNDIVLMVLRIFNTDIKSDPTGGATRFNDFERDSDNWTVRYEKIT